jgi:hypothetical protein
MCREGARECNIAHVRLRASSVIPPTHQQALRFSALHVDMVSAWARGRDTPTSARRHKVENFIQQLAQRAKITPEQSKSAVLFTIEYFKKNLPAPVTEQIEKALNSTSKVPAIK